MQARKLRSCSWTSVMSLRGELQAPAQVSLCPVLRGQHPVWNCPGLGRFWVTTICVAVSASVSIRSQNICTQILRRQETPFFPMTEPRNILIPIPRLLPWTLLRGQRDLLSAKLPTPDPRRTCFPDLSPQPPSVLVPLVPHDCELYGL